jgi:glycosyl transferase family 1
LDVSWPSGRSTGVFIDMHDRADLFYPAGFERASLYFKRSYSPEEIARAGVPASRIVPFGAMFNVATFSCKRLILRAWFNRYGLAQPRALSLVRETVEYPGYSTLITSPSTRRPNGVLLRTRLWEESEVRGDDTAAAVNEERIRWIRELKLGLGSRFFGGVLPTPVAERACPELIDRSAGGRRAYLKDLRNSAISIYTRGLHGSTAWKLPESMAAGCAVVGEPLSHILPEPLENGVHLVHASTPEACVEVCHGLLDNPDSLLDIQRNGRSYFDSYMHPEQRMAMVMARAAQQAGDDGLPRAP